MHTALEEQVRNVRIALEAQSPDKLVRMRSEMLAAEARRMLRLAQRYSELGLTLSQSYRRLLQAADIVQASMSALAQQSSGMWEAHLRASQKAIARALEEE